jgi:hypothetical protein
MALSDQLSEGYEEREINFRETVQPGAGVRVSKHLNFPGRVTKVMMHFPPGTSGLVDMKLEKDKNSFYPQSGFIALDDATPVYHTNIDYYRREPLDLVVRNRDEDNEHTVTCTVVIRFKKPGWY